MRLSGINISFGTIGPGRIKVLQMMATVLSLKIGPNLVGTMK
jgi:hypothetical protein